MRILAITVLLLATAGCYSEQIDALENRQEWIISVAIRNRIFSKERCAGFSDDKMTCGLTAEKVCGCTFKPDAQDEENDMYAKAVELLATQLKEEEEAVAIEDVVEGELTDE